MSRAFVNNMFVEIREAEYWGSGIYKWIMYYKLDV